MTKLESSSRDVNRKANNTIEEDQTKLVNGMQVVQTMLDEFQHKNLLINEILHVFEPSSKKGFPLNI